MFKRDEIIPDESNRCNLMVDIESMSTSHDAAILTIGVLYFDPQGHNTEEELRAQSKLFGPISLEDNEKQGRHFSGGTIHWWLTQSREAQMRLVEGSPGGLINTLVNFNKWMNELKPKPSFIWANSPSFDLIILKDAFAKANILWPFGFWAERDVRTIKEAAYPHTHAESFPNFETGVAHDAVDDCIKQAMQVQHCFRVIEKKEQAFSVDT